MSADQLRFIYERLRMLPCGRYYVNTPLHLYIHRGDTDDYVSVYTNGDKYSVCCSMILLDDECEKYYPGEVFVYRNYKGWIQTDNPLTIKRIQVLIAMLESCIEFHNLTIIASKPDFNQLRDQSHS